MVAPLRTSAGQIALSLLACGVAAYAIVAYVAYPIGAAVHPDIRASFEAHRIGVYGHVFAAAVALLLGPLQFSARLRRARPPLHRLLGRLYLALGVGIGGVAGLYLALYAYGGVPSSIGFGLLAILWLYTGARAYAAVRARRFDEHRAWMMRNFALAFAAVTLRIYLGASVAVGLPFETSYRWIAWISWIPNLVLAELLIRNRAARGSANAAT